ncbi:hypothetical protein [Oryzobacter telluris]|uniref:hypothetical protein n=1 Tax=Oryzobacter telluris TaxID=3149179 RepID=UPI00370D6389
MDKAEKIWKRASRGGGRELGEGDAALAGALAFHALVREGGVLHAFEDLSPKKLQKARDGFAFLGLSQVTRFVEDTAQSIADTAWDDEGAVEALESGSNEAYAALLPDDQPLKDAFRTRLAEHPEAFTNP